MGGGGPPSPPGGRFLSSPCEGEGGVGWGGSPLATDGTNKHTRSSGGVKVLHAQDPINSTKLPKLDPFVD